MFAALFVTAFVIAVFVIGLKIGRRTPTQTNHNAGTVYQGTVKRIVVDKPRRPHEGD